MFVTGFISFLIILLALNGRTALGILRFKLPPNSKRLKNESSKIEISLEAPIEFLRLIERFSVRLKIFLMFKLDPKEIPKSSIFECVKSKSNPRLNLSLGKRKIEDVSDLSFSSKIILGYLKFPRLEKNREVSILFSSL